nr:DNA polymerase III subunit gamma/tau [Novosphingobium sp. Gsoil 351]
MPGLGLDQPAQPQPAQPYRVLARKYRPQTFSELIGQEPMVRTLGNAIRRERLAHAFLMTGVRGVGKTSTARLIAKALNCIGPDGQGGPTIDPCGTCEPCRAIAEGRHIDVIEMDAASHNGIDDVRAMTDAVRYAAVTARYKIYIIDEVHMMSKPAFNALLKTLEEPPAHVKFLFATTEVDKLPITVLSRCQRFDLRRITTPMLTEHFARICAAEKVEADDEALALIAAAAEGSVRDGLSILDQAIAHADLEGEAVVTAAKVREMLGLADKTVQRRLFATILRGEGKALLDLVAEQYALGIEPLALIRAQMDLVHRITVAQLGESGAQGATAEERAALEGWAGQLSAGQLHRLWQLLLKGHGEIVSAPDPLAAAQMALLRVLHAADLPDPGQLAKKLEEMAARSPVPAPAAGRTASAEPVAALDWTALVERIETARPLVGGVMRNWIRPVDVSHGVLRFQIDADYRAEDPAADIRKALEEVTRERWQVERGVGDAQPSLRERAEAEATAAQAALLADPLVKAAFAAFPDAQLVDDERASPGRTPWSRSA